VRFVKLLRVSGRHIGVLILLTSSSLEISRRATISILTGCDGDKIYFAAALGTQEWLKRRLARGKIPWPKVERWEWIAKLLFPKRENKVFNKALGMGGAIGHMGGTGIWGAGPCSSDRKVEPGEPRVGGRFEEDISATRWERSIASSFS
jgi:hypothetical protein